MKNHVLTCPWPVQFLCILYRVDGWSNFTSTQILHGAFANYDIYHYEQIVTLLSSDFQVTSYYMLGSLAHLAVAFAFLAVGVSIRTSCR